MKAMKYEGARQADVDQYLTDDAWVAEQKLDGVRLTVHVKGNRVVYGDPQVKFAAASQWFDSLTPTFAALPDGAVIDGELIIETGVFWAFDLPYLPGHVKPESAFEDRRYVLEHLVPLFDSERVRLVPQATTTTAKRALWERVQATGAEGIVVKRRDGHYAIGRRVSHVLKVKVTKTMDVVVTGRNAEGGCNAELSLMRDGKLIVIGRCSMIGKPKLGVGDCAEVKFLYMNNPDNPRLYQPTLLRARPDKTPAECEWRQVEGNFTSREVVTL